MNQICSFSKTIKLAALVLLFVTVTGIMPVFPSGTAIAAGFVTLSVNEGLIGDRIEVNGSGYISNMTMKAYISSDEAVVGNEIDIKVKTYNVIGEVIINSMAMFSSPIYFNIPSRLEDGVNDANVTSGDYYIYVVYAGNKRIEAKAKLFVLGPVILSPSTGKIGERTVVNGRGFTPTSVVNMYFSSDRVKLGSTIDNQVGVYENVGLVFIDNAGNIGQGISFLIPERLTDGKYKEDVHCGDYYLYLTYVTSKTIITITRYTVIGAEIQIEPIEGIVGSEIAISGKGMRPDQPITITYDDNIVNTGDENIKTDANGNVNCHVSIPASTIGSHAIQVADVTGNKPEAWFTVKPSLVVPESVNAQQTISISGDSFSEAQALTVTINNQYIMTVPADITTNRRGYFTAKIQAPSVPGIYSIRVTDGMEVKAESQFTVLALPELNASITLNPLTSPANPGYVGEQLTVTGSNFMPDTDVTVNYGDGQSVSVPSTTTDTKGNFLVSFIIPKGRAGSIIVTATDNTKTANATFILESESPPPPVPVIPEVASGVKPTTRFDWTDTIDKSGVTYSLQVATDTNFTTGVLEKTGLTQSEYTLANQEKLDLRNRQSEYFWRVKAIDGAGNESGWTVPLLFYVGSARLGVPWWYILIFVGLGLLLIVCLSIWLRQVIKNRKRMKVIPR